MSEKALTRLELILEAEDDGVAYRAVRDVLYRIGTRTFDHAHSGHVPFGRGRRLCWQG